MADLFGAIKEAIDSVEASKGKTDLVFGTVTQVNPVRIRLSNDMVDIPTEALVFTENVVEKKLVFQQHLHYITNLDHSHQYEDYTSPTSSRIALTDPALTGTYPTLYRTQLGTYYINGTEMEVIGSETSPEVTVVINRSLAVGDKVVMVRAHDGQRFIVLSKVFTSLRTTLD